MAGVLVFFSCPVVSALEALKGKQANELMQRAEAIQLRQRRVVQVLHTQRAARPVDLALCERLDAFIPLIALRELTQGEIEVDARWLMTTSLVRYGARFVAKMSILGCGRYFEV